MNANQQSAWFMVTPWGDFANEVGMQRVQPVDGDVMIDAFNRLRQKLGPAFKGVPIYAGHPDARPQQYPDKRRYGRVDELQSRSDGLYAQVTLNDLGKQAIEQGHYVYASPAWTLRPNGAVRRPIELLSIGLTNTPQIPGIAWALNEEPHAPRTTENLIPASETTPMIVLKANDWFISAVNEEMRAGRAHKEAWAHVAALHPKIYSLMMAAGKQSPAVIAWNTQRSQLKRLPQLNIAREEYASIVHRRMRETGESYGAAYNACKLTHPAAWNEANPSDPPWVQLGSSGSSAVSSARPSDFLLPDDASQHELEIAFKANGGKTKPLNPGKVLEALASYMAELSGVSLDRVMESASAKYSDLWEAVKQINDTQNKDTAFNKVMAKL